MKTFRKTVMVRAYHLLKTTSKDWSVCLKKAWVLFRLNKIMKLKEIVFYFEKKDGEIRKAKGSLIENYKRESERQKEPNPLVFTYYDNEKNAFRCFKIENFLMIENTLTIA